jgi:hypothetical protein
MTTNEPDSGGFYGKNKLHFDDNVLFVLDQPAFVGFL